MAGEQQSWTFYDFASEIWRDQDLREWVKNTFGVATGNFSLFCHDLKQKALDPNQWDDPEYWERLLEDANDALNGGPRKRRDRRWGKPDKFWRWAEDEKKDEMSRRTGKDIPGDDVERWHREWLDAGEPDGWGREISKPLD